MGAMAALAMMAANGYRHLPVRKPPTWLWRPGMGELKKGFHLGTAEPPALLAVVSMRELCVKLLADWG